MILYETFENCNFQGRSCFFQFNLFTIIADKKGMKTLVILYADSRSLHMFDRVFDGKSAFERCIDWADSCKKIGAEEIFVLADKAIEDECQSALKLCNCKTELIVQDKWTVHSLFSVFGDCAEKKEAENIIFAWADQPFVNFEITEKIINDHNEFAGEYTFAEGYPVGLCPEVINAGTCRILSQLSDSVKKEFGLQRVCRTSVFDLIKTDINSFEVETVISDVDYRLFRMNFNCGTKNNMLACKELFSMGILNESIEEISAKASENVKILKTVPSYYNISITDYCSRKSIYIPSEMERDRDSSCMPLEQFKELVKKISLFSETAVVSLSAWGEACAHPNFVEIVKAVLSEPGLSVLIETDGLHVTEDMCREIKEKLASVPELIDGGAGSEKIYWIVKLDAASKEKYSEVNNGCDGFEKAYSAVTLLSKYFAGAVYPQFVRMNENEEELEKFYRFWSDKNSPSGGKLIVQKYSSCCKKLAERKPADLSPLERNPCWHIRRDLTVLSDGTVCFCREMLRQNAVGNVFTDPLENLWDKLTEEVQNHMKNKYSEMCGKCDEFYTFSF